MKERYTIRWNIPDGETRAKIRERFGISPIRTLNDLVKVEIKAEDSELFFETANRGYFGVIR